MTEHVRGRTVLVTGASGFIGAALCRELTSAGAIVHGASRTQRSAGDQLRWWQGDVADGDFVSGLVRTVEPEVVFHLAGHVNGARALDQVLPCLHTNLVSTVHLLRATTEVGRSRVVLTGSLEEPSADEPMGVAASPYAASKRACGDYARMFHALFDTPVVIARPLMVYGPGQVDHTKIAPYVTLSLLRNERPRLSSGRRPADWVFVDDVVRGLMVVATAPGVEGRTIDLGTGTLVQVRDVVLQLADLIGADAEITFGDLPDRPFEQVRCADLADTRARIGWEPEVSLTEGLKRTVAWYAERS